MTSFDLPSDGGGFRILVARPEAPAPPGGYGIVYAMDAGWTFGTLCDLERLCDKSRSDAPDLPAVIVGLGWPRDSLIDFDRRGTDLVGQVASGASRAATLTLLTGQVIPRVEAALPINPAHRMILGHSFGGAFALQARADHPGFFSHVAAGSPSIWTDPKGIHAGARDAGGKLLVTVGALEDPGAAGAAGESADRIARLRERDMTGHARRFAQQASATFRIFDGVGHGAVIPGFLGAAHAFLRC
ncbi:hypothetical protein KUV28_03950 [Ferrimonas balearica]|nr:hypothetical protein [Ferrimonas balearica]